MARVSLCMIVRNEEKNLPGCLESVQGLFDEIVIVDTGSTDGTATIARSFQAKVIEFPWCDDFSAARNESLRHASGDWVFWLDADDRLDAAERDKLAALRVELDDQPCFYMMRCKSDGKSSYDEPIFLLQPRLFRNHPKARWRYRVHEQLAQSLIELGYESKPSDITIRHRGYLDDALVQRKINRDLRLLRLDYLAYPDDPAVLYHLAQTHLRIGNFEQAFGYAERLHRGVSHPSEWGVVLVGILATTLEKMGRLADAVRIVREGLEFYPDDRDLLLHSAEHHFLSERWAESERDLLRMLNAPPPRSPIRQHDPDYAVKSGLRLLGVLYARSGQLPRAEAAYQSLVERYPDFGHGWLCLADLHTMYNRHRFEESIQNLERCDQGVSLAKVLRAKMHMQSRSLAAAKTLLDEAVAELPTLVWPLWILGQWHELNGDPIEVTIAICHNILRRCPEHLEARTALTILLRQQQGATPSATVPAANAIYVGMSVG